MTNAEIKGRAAGAALARGLRAHKLGEQMLADAIRRLDICKLEEGIPHAYGNGIVLFHALEPYCTLFPFADRENCEIFAEQMTGTAYPSWTRLIAALEGAQDALEEVTQ